jgi:hypothetical protein
MMSMRCYQMKTMLWTLLNVYNVFEHRLVTIPAVTMYRLRVPQCRGRQQKATDKSLNLTVICYMSNGYITWRVLLTERVKLTHASARLIHYSGLLSYLIVWQHPYPHFTYFFHLKGGGKFLITQWHFTRFQKFLAHQKDTNITHKITLDKFII